MRRATEKAQTLKNTAESTNVLIDEQVVSELENKRRKDAINKMVGQLSPPFRKRLNHDCVRKIVDLVDDEYARKSWDEQKLRNTILTLLYSQIIQLKMQTFSKSQGYAVLCEADFKDVGSIQLTAMLKNNFLSQDGNEIEAPEEYITVSLKGRLLTMINVKRKYGANSEFELEDLGAKYRSVDATSELEFSELLNSMTKCLDETEIEILLLKFYRGLNHDAIAKKMGLKEVATRKRYSRALAKLKSFLTEEP